MSLPRSSASERVVQAAVGVSCALAIGVSLYLRPDPRGHGTHERFGLPPCGFALYLHLPCPTCGLTTSFAHMGKLEVKEAFLTQPMGVVGFSGAVAAVLGAMVTVPMGISWVPLFRRVRWATAGWIIGGVWLASWIFEMIRWRFLK